MEWGDLEWITSYERGNEAADVSRTEIRRHFHLIDYQRVNKQQKKNPKNSRRLVFFFGKDVAERYGTLLLFGKKKIIAELEAERERESGDCDSLNWIMWHANDRISDGVRQLK